MIFVGSIGNEGEIMKVTKGFTLDGEIYDNFVNLVGKGNVSAAIQDYMRDYVGGEGSPDTINYIILTKENSLLKDNIDKMNAEYIANRTKLKAYEDEQKQKEIQRLKEEKEESKKLELACVCCGSFNDDFWYNYKTGWICYGCHRGFDDDLKERWGIMEPLEVKSTNQLKDLFNIKGKENKFSVEFEE